LWTRQPTRLDVPPECGTPLLPRCRRCDAELPPGAKFCNRCGTPIATAAQTAGERAPRTYTPPHLAEKILTTRAALEGERKQVTVLFADVKGSLELAEQMDPEEWHLILDRFFAILADGVHRFEGTVNQYTGDGIMALFGAPIAHEDHAQRTCWAALHLRDELRRYAEELRRCRPATRSRGRSGGRCPWRGSPATRPPASASCGRRIGCSSVPRSPLQSWRRR
jgi:hypothetical protein